MTARFSESVKQALLKGVNNGVLTVNDERVQVNAGELRIRNTNSGLAFEFFCGSKLAFTIHTGGTRLVSDETVTITGVNFSTDLKLEVA